MVHNCDIDCQEYRTELYRKVTIILVELLGVFYAYTTRAAKAKAALS